MITPYPYQSAAIAEIQTAFKAGYKHLILASPTGSGKTVIFTIIAKLVAEKNKKTLIFTNRAELLNQAGGSLKKVGLQAYFIAPGIKYYSPSHNVYVAMAQTFRNRIKEPYWVEFLSNIDLVIIDELHIQDFNYLFESGYLANKHVIGFSATPKRTGGMRQLALDYEKIIQTVSVPQLIQQNKLVNLDEYTIRGAEFEDVPIDYKNGDYKTGALYQKFDSPKLYSGVVQNWLELVPDTRTLVFCVNIQHSIKTALEFNQNGVPAKYIVSDIGKPKRPAGVEPSANDFNVLDQSDLFSTANDSDIENLAKWERYRLQNEAYNLYVSTKDKYSGDRESVFNGHKNGKFQVLVNAGIATTGYDDPKLETGILNRATLSLQLYLQMIGRITRATEGKTHGNILDFGGNIERFGSYTEPRLWSLWHEKIDGKGLPPIKTCGFDSSGNGIKGNGLQFRGCNRPILASLMLCPFCGFVYPKREAVEVELKLTANTKSVKSMNYYELHDYFKAKGHQTAWLWRQLYYKGGYKAIDEFGRLYSWNSMTIQKAKEFLKKV